MADPILRLDNPRVSVEPGGQAQVVVTVASASSIVEGYQLDVVGEDPTAWAEVIPPSVSVYPGEEATAVVVFSPPAGAASQSGTFPFGVRARSTEDPTASAVVEGDVSLGKVSGLQAKLVPVTSAGRWRGRHVIQLSNWGNSPVQLQLVPSDPDEALGFYLRPDLVDLPIGGTATVRMTVRTRKPFLRGTQTRLPFQVIGEPAGAPPGPRAASPYGDPSRPVVDGALNQKPILSKIFVTMVALVLVAGIAGGVYAFTRKPVPANSLEQLGTPEKVQEFALAPAGPDALKASWKPVPQVTGYRLQQLDQADKTTVQDEPPDLSGSLGQKRIDKLTPDTEYCFQLRALRDTKVGPASDVKCAHTDKAPATTSPTPSASTPPPTGQPSGPASGGQSTPTASQGGGGVPGDGGGVPGDGGGGPPSSGGPSTSSTGPSPGDPLAGGNWVLVAKAVRENGSAEDNVKSCVKDLLDQGFTNAQVIRPNTYPKLKLIPTGPPLTDTWLAVVGPFKTQPEAAALDAQVDKICHAGATFPVQPDPSS